MAQTYTISENEVRMLREIQVSFHIEDGNAVIEQIEIHQGFTGFYETADLEKFSESGKERLREICANWLDKQCFSKDEFNNDDPGAA